MTSMEPTPLTTYDLAAKAARTALEGEDKTAFRAAFEVADRRLADIIATIPDPPRWRPGAIQELTQYEREWIAARNPTTGRRLGVNHEEV